MIDINNFKNTELPLVALRGIVVFPNSTVSFDVGRTKSIQALDEAAMKESYVFLAAQKDSANNDPGKDDLYSIGTIARIKQVIRLPGGAARVLVEGLEKAAISKFIPNDLITKVYVSPADRDEGFEMNNEVRSLIKIAHEIFEKYCTLLNKFTPDIIMDVISCEDPGRLSYMLCTHSNLKCDDKQLILEESNCVMRLTKAVQALMRESELLEIQKEIFGKVKVSIDQHQKEYFLKEQLKVIQDELGDKDGIAGEIVVYRERAQKLRLPEQVSEKLEKEFVRLKRITNTSPEAIVIRDYVDWILELPWSNGTNENKNLKKAEDILNKEHYGLEKVKERIIEFLAVRQNTSNLNSPVLCLIGPPGVGKTSIAKSIARALNRKYIRMSLGGVHDEAEIRGHRKTYIGAMPGRVIYAMKQAKTKNPLILLDEIDKMSSDFRGNPAAAMLEVLDGEQNNEFRDHYIEVPYDLSDVLFICTANSMDGVPPALVDRMEIINLPSYTEDEKINISKKFLLEKQLKKHGLKKSAAKIKDKVFSDIIRYYTKEAGVRQLERLIGQICRKIVKEQIVDLSPRIAKNGQISFDDLEHFLGKKKYRLNKMNETSEVGVARGLAWTSVGGDTLEIEANVMQGAGKFELTGNVGKVMKESAQAAVSYIRSKCGKFGLETGFYKEIDIHIHIPEGAVPKDGPSAGITIAVAIASALTGKAVYNNIGMTGEITIRGRVLPIGGLKEKVLAAKNAGLTKLIVPFENESDISEIPAVIKSGLEFILVKNMDEVMEHALTHV